MLDYRLEGSGPPLLLIHGWGVSYTIWQNLAPLLSTHFQLIMIELPGVGRSPNVEVGQPYYPACAAALEDLRRSLNIEQWSILAYSTGTRVAEAYLQLYPEHITRAIFLCPIYLHEWWSLAVRLLDTTHPPENLKSWILSDWRLYGLVMALGFSGQRHDYLQVWKNEIELQPLETLIRSLCELPGRGRAPFTLSPVPTLFVWGNRDVLTARPRRPQANDIVIPANHSAPMLAAHSIVEVITPFLTEGRLTSSQTQPRWGRLRSRRRGKDLAETRRLARLISLLRHASPQRFIQVVREIEIDERYKV